MRQVLIGMSIVMLFTVASAQNAPPKSVKTLKIQKSSPQATSLYVIEPDGAVKIDWDAVESLACSKVDRTISPMAEVMLAIRDRKWKPLR